MSLLTSQGETRNPHNSQAPLIPGGGIDLAITPEAIVPDELSEPLRDLAAPTRRAMVRHVGQYARRPFLAVMRDEFGLIVRRGGQRPPANYPVGVFEVNPERVNNDARSPVTYGSLVGLNPAVQEVVF